MWDQHQPQAQRSRGCYLLGKNSIGRLEPLPIVPANRREPQPAVLPPSAVSICPVTNDAFSEARKTAARAISAGSPTRPSGTLLARAAFLSAVPVKRPSIPISVGPGATALTRTPELAASSAADFVTPSTACLLPA